MSERRFVRVSSESFSSVLRPESTGYSKAVVALTIATPGISRNMIEIISGMPDNVVAVMAHGKVTGEDYDRVFSPTIEEKLRTHKKIRLLYCLGKDFSGYTVIAMLDDAKVGAQHLAAFEKMAIVSDVHWVTEAAKFFGFFIPCPVTVYGNEELSEAKRWITE
jgi:SpoIIAA-like